MSPTQFVEEMRASLTVKHVLTPKQILDASPFLDEGYKFIAKKLENEFEDMTPAAVEIAGKLQGFLLVFVEHGNNFALLRNLEASG